MKSMILWVALLLLGANAWAAPAQVLIIRHAEKPESGKDLSPQGEARAQALVGFFENDPRVTRYGTPAAIYAMSDEGGTRTHRPIETVAPLAEALGLSLHAEYTEDQADQMVNDILANPQYDGKMVLICWVHQTIPQLAGLFGASSAPGSWDSSAYDRVWELDFGANGIGFADLPQHLMPGDSAQ